MEDRRHQRSPSKEMGSGVAPRRRAIPKPKSPPRHIDHRNPVEEFPPEKSPRSTPERYDKERSSRANDGLYNDSKRTQDKERTATEKWHQNDPEGRKFLVEEKQSERNHRPARQSQEFQRILEHARPRSRQTSRSAWEGPTLERETQNEISQGDDMSRQRISQTPCTPTSENEEDFYFQEGGAKYSAHRQAGRRSRGHSNNNGCSSRKTSWEETPEESGDGFHSDRRKQHQLSHESSLARQHYGHKEQLLSHQQHSRRRSMDRSPVSSPRTASLVHDEQNMKWASHSPTHSGHAGRDQEHATARFAHKDGREPSLSGTYSPMYMERERRKSASRSQADSEDRMQGAQYNHTRLNEERQDASKQISDKALSSSEKPIPCRDIDAMMGGVQKTFFNPADYPKVLGEQAQVCTIPLGCPGTICRALITRQQGIVGKINPLFKFSLEGGVLQNTSPSPILWSKKSSAVGMHVPFLISAERVDLELPRFSRSDGFIGKLSNKGGGKYVLYDAGCNPYYLAESDDESQAGEDDIFGIPPTLIKPRCELGCVVFNKDVHRPEMEVGIPHISYSNGASTIHVWQPREAEEELINSFELVTEKWGHNHLMADQIYCLSTEEVSRLVGTEDHKRRFVQESVKNFQVVLHRPSLEEEDYTFEDQNSKLVWLQMHKVSKNAWSVEFVYPLSMLQAFGFCLARFDHRFKR